MKLINKSIFIVINSLFLLVSLVTNTLLYKELKNIYLSLYATSLNPLGLQKYSDKKTQIISTSKKQKVIFFGDSRAYAWRNIDLEEFQFINRGISGQTSAQVLLRFDRHVAVLDPDIIVVQVGINDLRMLTKSSQTREDLVNNCQENIAQIVHKAQEIGAKVIVTTIFPLGEGNVHWKYRAFWPPIKVIKQDIMAVNNYIKTLGQDAVILDAYDLLKAQGENSPQYYQDLLHLSDRGYQLLNQELSELLAKLSPSDL